MSSRMIYRVAFAMILRATSQTPIGRTPGHLSKAINLHERKEARMVGDKYVVHNQQTKRAIASHKSLEAAWKEVQIRRQLFASTPEGPGAPKVWRAADRITEPVRASNTTG